MKKIIKYVFLVLIIILVILSLPNNNHKKPSTIKKKKEITNETNTIDKLKKEYNNNDIVGTINIENTDINEIIMQSTDNDYYLKHDNYGNYDKYGSVFLDYRCNKDSKKLLVFGHNDYKEETPFSNLENYYEEEYFKNNQYINIVLEDKKMRFQIFSVYIETKDFTYMNLKINDEKYSQDLIKYKNKSFYDTNVEVSKNDDILILQTCSNHKDYKKYKDKYLLIIAKKI